MNPTHDGYKALVKAVQIGVTEPAVGWVDQLQSDTRSHAIAAGRGMCELRTSSLLWDRPKVSATISGITLVQRVE